jgi:hypothetical protein
MQRRAFLGSAALALSAGCLSNLPAATGPRRPPGPPPGESRRQPELKPLYIVTFEIEANEAGNLVARITVGNRSDSRQAGTVRGVLTVDGDERVKTESVTLEPGAETEVEFTYDVPYEAFNEGGSFEPRVE